MNTTPIHQGSHQKQTVGNTSMTHTKFLDKEPTHIVLTVETDGIEPTEMHRGSKRECTAYINNSNLITLTIEPICE